MTSSLRGPLLAGLSGLALLLASCGGGDSDDTEPTAEPTETAAATEPSGGGGGGELFGGREVGEFFSLNCSACHGENREGVTGLGLPLLPDVLTEGDDFYFDPIKNGRTGTVMPAWGQSGVSDDEITALVEFIRTAP